MPMSLGNLADSGVGNQRGRAEDHCGWCRGYRRHCVDLAEPLISEVLMLNVSMASLYTRDCHTLPPPAYSAEGFLSESRSTVWKVRDS